jgi:hypothetical protein
LAEERKKKKKNNNNNKNNKKRSKHNMSPKLCLRDIITLYILQIVQRLDHKHHVVLILLLLLSFFRQKFIRHISRRLLNGNQWNFTGMLSTMSRYADYFWNFLNGHCCHGNGQNAKKLKNTKMIIAGYSPNRNWWNLIGTTSTSSGTR